MTSNQQGALSAGVPADAEAAHKRFTIMCETSGGLDDESDMDPCNYCPHDNTDHRGDGCLHCGCDVPQ